MEECDERSLGLTCAAADCVDKSARERDATSFVFQRFREGCDAATMVEIECPVTILYEKIIVGALCILSATVPHF